MKNGRIKRILYSTKVIPTFSKILNFRENQRNKYLQRIENNPTRWYFKFLPVKKNKIVFDNFLGRGYGDNPKAIAEEIIRQGLHWDLVWLTNKAEELPPQIRQVKYGSPEAMRELATAKLWVFNCRNVMHPRKQKKQKYLQTWHAGYVVKLIEKEAEDKLSERYKNDAKADGQITDAAISSSAFFTSIYKNSFWLNSNSHILEIGTPKNDVLFDEMKKEHFDKTIREKYGIDSNKKIILYFPTFRDSDLLDSYDIDYQKIITAFTIRFKKEYVMLVRFHPNVHTSVSREKFVVYNRSVINATDYPEACELFCIADSIISDYSGVMIAFALQRKPFFVYARDYDDYISERGFNELYQKLPCRICKTNDELVKEILDFDNASFYDGLEKMYSVIHPYDDGNASARAVEWIKNQIN